MITRRLFLSAACAAPLLSLPACDGKTASRFASLAEAQAALDRLQTGGARQAGPISVHQMLVHCRQSLDYGLAGFPALKPDWFRASIGPAAAQAFLWQGRMYHDLADPIPGAPEIAAEGDLPAAFAAIRESIAAFETAVKTGRPLQPHFAYGDVAPADYARLQAFHIAQHVDAVT
ncbi:DUF1569 domain-containing protein [Ferrovibrio sp.]|uniref:DUF1569 domain-containing protein n=1 Tax=Ferrovibrio sp. TaxID=1917215 RepID=UPI0026222C34|nr:DUF1569 domain-containing protein [Ferrovibrio sp.]